VWLAAFRMRGSPLSEMTLDALSSDHRSCEVKNCALERKREFLLKL